MCYPTFSIDATNNDCKARNVNDSPWEKDRLFANACMKCKIIRDKPRLLLFARRYIAVGTEIR